jgi:hypothetical protein
VIDCGASLLASPASATARKTAKFPVALQRIAMQWPTNGAQRGVALPARLDRGAALCYSMAAAHPVPCGSAATSTVPKPPPLSSAASGDGCGTVTKGARDDTSEPGAA